jgi:hypothetical protein
MTKKKPKSEHKDAGRPTILTPQAVAKLENAFAQGFNITHACGIAEISRDTYYDHIKKNPKFSDKIEWLRSKPYIKSVLEINKAINTGDLPTCRWYAERKGKDEFSLRTELSGKDGSALGQTIVVTEKELEEARKRIENESEN